VQARPCPSLADRFIAEVAPSITAWYFSSSPSDSTSRWTPCPPGLPAPRRYSRFGYESPNPRLSGTSTHRTAMLPRTHYRPIRTLPPSVHFPVSLVIGPTFLQRFLTGAERASPVALCVLLPCCRYHPAEVNNRVSQFAVIHAVFTLRMRARPSGQSLSGPPYAFTFVAAWQLVIILLMIVSIGFRISVSLYPAIRTTWLLTLAMAGLSPAEHTRLNWTHIRDVTVYRHPAPIV